MNDDGDTVIIAISGAVLLASFIAYFALVHYILDYPANLSPGG